MSKFDSILKKGKSAVSENSTQKIWMEHINAIVNSIHMLNDMYGDTLDHHLVIEPINCPKCGAAGYTLSLRDIDQRDKVIRFYMGTWKAKDSKYYCSKCKNP